MKTQFAKPATTTYQDEERQWINERKRHIMEVQQLTEVIKELRDHFMEEMELKDEEIERLKRRIWFLNNNGY